MIDKENIKNIVELFLAWNGETEAIDVANIDSAVDFISDSLQEEPASEDLEEAADKYAFRDSQAYKGVHCTYVDDKIAFKAGAKWQKQQMMKDAVEGTVKYEIGSAEIPQCDRRYQVLSDPTPITNAKLGDKVKIIILKTE